jgi:hypothetical protein
MTPQQSVHKRRVFAVLACVVAVIGTVSAVTASSAAASTPAAPAHSSTAQPYSDPIWFPLHVAAQVGCVGPGDRVNNGPHGRNPCAGDHLSYYGLNLDITAAEGNPTVYAAGSGQVVGVVSGKDCGGAKGSAGNYVAIAHGGGQVSFYEHLLSPSVKVGQLVAAGDPIGRAGHSGAPCSGPVYLDFVVRTDGGGYQDLTQSVSRLQACTRSGVEQWPSALGSKYTSWVSVPYLSLTVPASVGGCGQDATPTAPPAPTGLKATAGRSKAIVSWTNTQTDAVELQQEIYRPTTKTYDAPCSPNISAGCAVGYAQLLPGTSRYVVSGLQDGRTYRFRISRHNASGWSLPGAWVTVMPKSAPKAPTYRALNGYGNHIRLFWSLSTNDRRGSTVSGYQVKISRKVGSRYRAWSYKKVGNVLHYSWSTHANTRYRVTVRAISNAGYSPWMTRHVITTPRK